jgi:hypothetical protein
MTTVALTEPAAETAAEPKLAEHRRPARSTGWIVRLPAGLPLTALLVCYPLWWALGLPVFIYGIFAIPMAFQLYQRGRVRVPPGFGFWLVLLAWVALSGLLLGESAPDTLPTSVGAGIVGFSVRVVNYVALTVIMLYVLSLEERELPRLRVVRMLGVVCLVTVVGGYIGMLAPGLSFMAPLNAILPATVTSDPFVDRLMHIEVAQVQDILDGGTGQPRPSAPFEYTNTWGQNICILLVWLAVGWSVLGTRARRFAGIGIAVLAVVPIVYSLNRGVWIGCGISILYIAARLAMRGKVAPLGGIAVAVGLFAVLMVATPLGATVTERLSSGHSDDIRAKLNSGAVNAAVSSPILGYGANRPLIGSGRSIAIGKSDECLQCGNRLIGSDGMLWHLLIAQGFVGAICYNAFFLWNLWRYRRDHSAIGIGASTVLVLVLFFQLFYGSLNSTLAYGLISVALLARNDLQRRREALRT